MKQEYKQYQNGRETNQIKKTRRSNFKNKHDTHLPQKMCMVTDISEDTKQVKDHRGVNRFMPGIRLVGIELNPGPKSKSSSNTESTSTSNTTTDNTSTLNTDSVSPFTSNTTPSTTPPSRVCDDGSFESNFENFQRKTTGVRESVTRC